MRDSNFRISLDIHTLQSQMTLAVKLGETSRKICVALTEHGLPYNIGKTCFATFQGTKADGTKIADNCIIENNQIVYSFTTQTTAASGILNADFILYSVNGGIIASPNITIIVDERAIGNIDTIISEDEINILDSIAMAEAGRVNAEAERADAETARAEAEAERVRAEAERTTNLLTSVDIYKDFGEKDIYSANAMNLFLKDYDDLLCSFDERITLLETSMSTLATDYAQASALVGGAE